ERIRLSGQHLRSLVDDVLDLAKAESGRIEVAREPAFVASTVNMALALAGPQLGREVTLENLCEGNAEDRFVGDEDRVRQIIVNLLSNAVKFTPTGGTVRIRCGRSSNPDPAADALEGGTFTFIEVSDTGIGIPPERIESIFHPFFQIE